MIGLIVGQKTFHSSHAPAEKIADRMGAQMSERIVNENVDRAGDDVVGRVEPNSPSSQTNLALCGNGEERRRLWPNSRAAHVGFLLAPEDVREADRSSAVRPSSVFFNRVGHGQCKPMIRQRSTALEAIFPASRNRTVARATRSWLSPAVCKSRRPKRPLMAKQIKSTPANHINKIFVVRGSTREPDDVYPAGQNSEDDAVAEASAGAVDSNLCTRKDR